MRSFRLFALVLLANCHSIYSQTISPHILDQRWKAYWIAVPDASPNDYGVYNFRKTVQLATKPSAFIVHVSAEIGINYM